MGRIIRWRGNPHRETEELLPWYVTGQIDPVDRVKVEAHLADCADCQAELAFERRLHVDVADLPIDVELGWADCRRRLDATPPPPPMREAAQAVWRIAARPGKLGWFLAAQMAVVLGIAVEVSPIGQPVAPYRTLGSAPTEAAGNAIVVFRPDTREQDLRRVLNASGARLVGGPTAADAYVLHVAPTRRAAALARLRAETNVVLAEPLDAASPS